jgi:hypothetical protein
MDLKMGEMALFWRLKALKVRYFRVCVGEFRRSSGARWMAGPTVPGAAFSNKTDADIYFLEYGFLVL